MKTRTIMAALLLSLVILPAWASDFAIDWWSLNGGGGTSTGGAYAVSGVLGQSGVAHMSGGPFALTVGISGGGAFELVTNAAPLTVTTLQVSLNFAKLKADSISLTARLNLPGITNVIQLTGAPVLVDVGDVQVPFKLDKLGRGVNANGTCRLAYTKPTKKLTGYWTATIALSKGTWRIPLAAHGLINATIKTPGRVVILPVAVLIDNEGFGAEKQLHYTATLNKTGTAK